MDEGKERGEQYNYNLKKEKNKVLFKQSLKEEWAHDSCPDFRSGGAALDPS